MKPTLTGQCFERRKLLSAYQVEYYFHYSLILWFCNSVKYLWKKYFKNALFIINIQSFKHNDFTAFIWQYVNVYMDCRLCCWPTDTSKLWSGVSARVGVINGDKLVGILGVIKASPLCMIRMHHTFKRSRALITWFYQSLWHCYFSLLMPLTLMSVIREWAIE